eukprot:10315940-Lingulodinium_polyedra.AAC.1
MQARCVCPAVGGPGRCPRWGWGTLFWHGVSDLGRCRAQPRRTTLHRGWEPGSAPRVPDPGSPVHPARGARLVA